MIIIPAKYGSSRTPLKNYRSFYRGLSLLQIAIIRCVISKCGPVIVSSENVDETKLQLSRLPEAFRLAVSIHGRPMALAKDPATILDVVADVVSSLPGDIPKNVAVVLPTSPYSSVADIKGAFKAFSGMGRLLSVSESSKPPFNSWTSCERGAFDMNLELTFPDNPYRLTQSTACPKTYFSNGCISIYCVETLMKDRDFGVVHGYEMPLISSVDIDHEFEFELARRSFSSLASDVDEINPLALI